MNIRTTACLLLLDKNLGAIKPIFVRKKTAKGSSKITPKPKTKVPTKVTYLLIVIIGLRTSVAKLSKNFIPIGTTIKYPKEAPMKKIIRDNGPNIRIYFFSFGFKAKDINFHISKRTKGEDKNSPTKKDIFILVINASCGAINTSFPIGLTKLRRITLTKL